MPFVRRDEQGLIASLHRSAETDAGEFLEFLEVGDKEVLAFVGATPAPASDFDQLDAGFVRVLEDLIDTLIVKNLLNITDLPEQAQAKLFARKSFRERVSQSSLQLFEKTDFGDVI
jgi:hypothetical protein